MQQAMNISSKDPPTLVASQKKKLWLFGVMLAFAGLSFLFKNEISHFFEVDSVVVNLGALLLTLIAFVAALLMIRCAHCDLRLVLYAMTHHSAGQWLEWLLTVKKCPKCGHPQ